MAPWKQFILKAQRESQKRAVILSASTYGNGHYWYFSVIDAKGRRNTLFGYKFDKNNPFNEWSFVNFAMEMVNFCQLWVNGLMYYKKDLYRAEHHFSKKGAYEMFEKVIEKTIQREKYLNFPIVRKEYENAREMLRSIRREIYTLFRYFTDSALKHAALSALGSSKKVNNDTVELQQVINRILNYHEDMAACVDRITTFENSIENKKLDCGGYFTRFGRGRDDRLTITLADVLDEIDAARIGYYQRTKSILKQQQL